MNIYSSDPHEMFIATSDSREPLFVPSVKCQSLLGKAVFEHFTKPEQIASVFSSSPSLRNSSAGANFLTNIQIDENIIKLFEFLFTPEECFSVQFTPSLNLFSPSSDQLENFIPNLVNRKYLQGSLRSLAIASDLITNEQLNFIFSRLNRITTLELTSISDITSEGLAGAIGENLPEITELRFSSARAVDTSALELFASKCKKLETLVLEDCGELNDQGVAEISKMSQHLTSLSIVNSWDVSSSGFAHLVSLKSLICLTVSEATKFDGENLQQLCTNLHLLQRLDLSNTGVSDASLKYLRKLEFLESLILTETSVSDLGLKDICHLKMLKEIDLAKTSVTDTGVEKISGALSGLKKIVLWSCKALTSKSLEALAKLEQLQELDLRGIELPLRATFSFLQATKTTMKRFLVSGKSVLSYHLFVGNQSSRVLNWAMQSIQDDDVFFLLVERLGDNERNQVQEINLSESQISERSISLIFEKMKNLRALKLSLCSNITFESLQLDNNAAKNLSELDLSMTEVDDAGVAKIVSAFGPSLKILNLCYALNISSESLDVIAEKCKSLEKIDVQQYNAISSSDVDEFKSKMPNCEVFANVEESEENWE
jgi:hypothetical protein